MRRLPTILLIGLLIFLGYATTQFIPLTAAPMPQPQPLTAVPPSRPLPLDHAFNVASYRMTATLDPAAKTVTGRGVLSYTNPSSDTLNEVWLRLYLKAFSSPETLWMRESGGEMRGFAMDAASLGDMTLSRIALPEGPNLLATATVTDTLLRLPLAQPLLPNQRIDLEVEWVSKLPRAFARTGYGGRDNTFFMVGQWYPKLVVYDRGRWDTIPWHANAEFFNDFGSYDLTITAPSDYVIASVGLPAGEPTTANGLKTWHFTAENVTDVAFAASPDFKVQTANAGPTEVVLYYLPEHEAAVTEYLSTSVGSLTAFSAWFGAYPHPRLSVIDVPDDAGGMGGMEYPTLVTGGTLGAGNIGHVVSLVTSHEIGHQWWPMQTATHEGREPWLDEGITEYSGMRYMLDANLGVLAAGNGAFSGIGADTFDRTTYFVDSTQPSNLAAWEYSEGGYGAAVYNKTGLGLLTLERVVGSERFFKAMSTYLSAYRYRHPNAADFRATIEGELGPLDWFFDDFIAGTGLIDYAVAPIEQTAQGSRVTLIRQGTVPAPVEAKITRASGATEIKQWDGRTERTSFDLVGDPVVTVELDPERKLAAEMNRLDNSTSTQVQVGAAITLGGRLVFLVQALLQCLSLFG